MENNRSLISLAIVKTLWDKKHIDYIEVFVPFVATLICIKKYTRIDVAEICKNFSEVFGLSIPYHPMIAILNRAKQREVIIKTNHEEHPNFEKAKLFDLSAKSAKNEIEHEKIIRGFIDFIKAKYEIELAKIDAENAFLSFLKTHDSDIIFANGQNSILPAIRNSRRGIYLFSKYVQWINTNDVETFRQIVNIAVGHALASALLFGGELKEQYEVNVRELKIFLDTRFVLRLLGIEGDARRFANEELIKVLINRGAKLFLFEHTNVEISQILENCFHWVENPKYDPRKASIAIRYCVENDFAESDVQVLINRLSSLYRKYSLAVVPIPDVNKDTINQIDETKLRQIVVNTYREQNLNFNEAEKDFSIQRDISSISSVYKLRKGRLPRNLKEAEFIFLTTNNALAYANRRFEFENKEERRDIQIPACLTDVFVGTILWMNSHVAVGKLNEKKLIADCISAVQPDAQFMEKFLSNLDKLKGDGTVGENEYVILRSSKVVRELLSEKTMGDPDAFTEKTLLEIREALRKELLKDAEGKHSREMVGKEMEIEYERAQKRMLENTLKDANLRVVAYRMRVERIVAVISRIIDCIIVVLLILLSIALGGLPYYSDLYGTNTVKFISALVAVLLLIASIFFSVDFKHIRTMIRKRIADLFMRLLLPNKF